MNSTEDAKGAAVRAFWRDKFVPLAAAMRVRGRSFHGSGAWTPFDKSAPEFMELEVQDLASALRAYWESQGLNDLASLVPDLMELADLLEKGPGPADEVSPFIYAMF